jgi:uncharacterized membrane protein
MAYVIFLVVMVFIFYLARSINRLDSRIRKLEQDILIKGVQPKSIPQGPIPEKFVPSPASSQAPNQEASILISDISTQNRDLELKFGSKLFTGVGAVAVLFGVGFFLRYAFEQNLITETMRIALGLVSGAILIGAGEYLRKKYDSYGQVLQGTGIGVFYLTFFAAYSFYDLLGQPVALIAMLVVTLVAVYLAIRANSISLAAVALFGAYITPILLDMVTGDPHKLFVYITLINFGCLLLALWRSWRAVTLGGLIGTSIIYVIWHSQSYNSELWTVSLIYLTIFFFTFLSANIYRYFIQKHLSDENDLALVIFNPMFYFLASYAVLQPVNLDYVGWFAFALSAIYIVLGLTIPKENTNAKIFHFGVASTLAFIGVPILFDKQWVTIGWAAEAAFLLFYSQMQDLKNLKLVAHIIFMVSLLRLLIVDSTAINGTEALLNGRALSFLVVIGLYAISAYFYQKREAALALQGIVNNDKGLEVLIIQAQVAAMFWSAAEIMKFGNDHWIGFVWTILALIVLWLGIIWKNYELRVLSYVTALFAVLRILVFDTEVNLALHNPVLNLRVASFVLVAAVLGLMLYALSRNKDILKFEEQKNILGTFFIAINVLLLWVLSLEVNDFFQKKLYAFGPNGDQTKILSLENSKRAALSVAWALYSMLLLMIGIAKKSALARLFSIALFSIVIFKVFLYDTANLSNFYRFVSFITLGVLLLLAGYLYNRHKDRIAEFIQSK